jgi:hypothetical protein
LWPGEPFGSQSGGSSYWQGGFDILEQENFAGSPAERLQATGCPVRQRSGVVIAGDYAVLRDLKNQGYSDYLTLKITMADTTLAFCSLVSDQVEG